MAKKKEDIAKAEEAIRNPQPKKEKKLEFISTGSTLLNLAISGSVNGGWPLGDMANVIGPSNVGKTLIVLSMFAEAVRDKRFDKYDFEYQAIETGLYFPLEEMFGKNINRMEILKKSPFTIQEWQAHMLAKTKKSYIGVLDSSDALTTKDDLKALEEGKIEKGGFRVEKPLVFSAALSPIVGQIEKNNGLLIIVSHAKKSLDMYGPKYRRSGGDSLRFYSTTEVWLKRINDITKKIYKEEEKIGEMVEAKVARTRITGKQRSITFPIYEKFGIDDVESMIDFLVSKEFWVADEETKKGKSKDPVIDTCGDFDNMKRYDLARSIEKTNQEDKLKQIVQECWDKLEEEISPSASRKPKYA